MCIFNYTQSIMIGIYLLSILKAKFEKHLKNNASSWVIPKGAFERP